MSGVFVGVVLLPSAGAGMVALQHQVAVQDCGKNDLYGRSFSSAKVVAARDVWCRRTRHIRCRANDLAETQRCRDAPNDSNGRPHGIVRHDCSMSTCFLRDSVPLFEPPMSFFRSTTLFSHRAPPVSARKGQRCHSPFGASPDVPVGGPPPPAGHAPFSVHPAGPGGHTRRERC